MKATIPSILTINGGSASITVPDHTTVVDILMNWIDERVGLGAKLIEHRQYDEITEEEWDKVIAVNVKGVFLCTKHTISALSTLFCAGRARLLPSRR